jgi:hypothetical protein
MKEKFEKKYYCDKFVDCENCPFIKELPVELFDEKNNFLRNEIYLFCEYEGTAEEWFS